MMMRLSFLAINSSGTTAKAAATSATERERRETLHT